jgi:hypothetical protein
MEIIRIRNLGWKQFGSGIRNTAYILPGHVTVGWRHRHRQAHQAVEPVAASQVQMGVLEPGPHLRLQRGQGQHAALAALHTAYDISEHMK